ncbi:MAG: murein biosynthesis integral membrane protein MurJ [Firmicutes bacterium]|nr:murein biosynthesis integral membrane protein MurJ [Bacillota bacterium]
MNKEIKSIVIVSLITILSRLSGFIREMTLASFYGVTFFTDAYLLSNAIPSVIFSGIAIALGTIFIPVYSNIVENESKNKALDFTNTIINIVILISVLMSVLTIMFTKPIVMIFASGFEGEILKLTIKFSKVLLLSIVFIGINYILIAFLEANKKYYIPVFSRIPVNAFIIISIILSYIININILIYGTLLSMFLQTIILVSFVYKVGYRYKVFINIKDENIKKMFVLVIPVFLSTAVGKLNVLIDKSLASTLEEGSISALNFGDKINLMIYGIVIASMITVIYPNMIKVALKDNIIIFKRYIIKIINIIILLVIPLSVLTMCLSTPIVKILFQRGHFNYRATFLTSETLFYYSIGLIGISIIGFLTRVFYSLEDSKTPVIIGVLTMIVNIILNFLLVNYLKHKGLALATSISSLFGAILLLFYLRKKLGSIGEIKIIFLTIKVSISSLFMFMGVKLFYKISNFLNNNTITELMLLLFSIIIGGLIYLLLIKLMKVKEFKLVSKEVKTFLKL